MSLTGSATIPATHADRLRAAQHSGRRIVDLVLLHSEAFTIPKRSLRLEITDRELQMRLSNWRRPPARMITGFLAIYAKLAASAAEGAILKTD